MPDIAIKIENLKKQYQLGAIGGQTLNAELQSWWARKRGKTDPNLKIGQEYIQNHGSFWALDGINLEIKKGEALGIIGSNGAGKSTLLKILSRVTAPTEGDVWIDGRISSMLEVGTGFHGELTGRENIYMNGAILGMTRKEVDAKIDSIIDFSECRQFIDTPVKRYSSGMYVKLAFAVASHLDSEVLIMDEVLAVGDMKFQRKCLGKMRDEAEVGKTILYVSHNMATIRNLCTRCIVLDRGHIAFDGNTEQAIEVYMKTGVGLSLTRIDNTLKERGNAINRLGSKGMIKSVEFVGKEALVFFDSEKVQIEIEVEAYENLENLYMGMSLDNADTSHIGFAYTKIPDMSCGGAQKEKFELDFSYLSAGNYRIQFNMHIQTDSNGFDRSIDQTDYIDIRIESQKNRLIWRKDWFGHVVIGNLKYVR